MIDSSSRIFHGWVVTAAAFAVTLMGFGSAYAFSAFFASLQHDFGASRGSVSLVFSLAGFLYFGLGIVSGPLADRWGARRLAVIGMVLTGIGLAAAGLAQGLMEVYIAYGLGVGVGLGCAYVPAVGAVQRWFVRRRGLASGLASAGIGVGTLVMPPLASLLIELWGWRTAYIVLGVLTVIVGGGMALLVENEPARRGLAPEGGIAPPVARTAPMAGASVGEAITSRRFIFLYIACLICAFGVFVPFVHLVPYALGHGLSQNSAVLLLSAIGIGSTAGRFFLGGLADRVGRQLTPADHVCRHGFRPGDLGRLQRLLVARGIRAGVRCVLWRLGRGIACRRHGLFRRPQCQRPDWNSLYQRRVRHVDRPKRRRIRLRPHAQLRGAHSGRRRCEYRRRRDRRGDAQKRRGGGNGLPADLAAPRHSGRAGSRPARLTDGPAFPHGADPRPCSSPISNVRDRNACKGDAYFFGCGMYLTLTWLMTPLNLNGTFSR